MRRTILFLILCLSLTAAAVAQPKDQKQFDPKQFEDGLEKFVIKTAGLTPAESKAFLPIFREKRKKEIESQTAKRKSRDDKPTTEKQWEEAVRNFDNQEIQLKKLQQNYHNRMLKVIPASKVFLVIKAEEKYHRNAFRKMHEHRGDKQGKHH